VSIAFSDAETVELFDRSRLLVDLDEATDPDSPASVLVVVGLRGIGLAETLRESFAAVVDGVGTVYCTRSTELCAILDGDVQDLAEVLDAVRGMFGREADQRGVRISTGLVELPREAHGAPEALALADRRMTVAHD
jgi:hypothetical protein